MAAAPNGNGYRRRLRAAVLVPTSIAVVAACASNGASRVDERAIAIYSAVIHSVAAPPPSGTVFVLGSHREIPLAEQAGVIDALHDFATIRFIDERSEAIDDHDAHKAVRDRGMLVIVGDIPPGPDELTMHAQRYERADVTADYTIDLRRDGSAWKPVRTRRG